MTLILWHFAKYLGDSRLPRKKQSIKAKRLRNGSTKTLLQWKKSKFQILIFGPPPTRQDPCRVHLLTKLHKSNKCPQPIWAGVPLISKFLSLASQPGLSAHFSWAVGWKSQFSSQHFFATSSGFQKYMTQPPHFKTLGGDRFGRNPLFGVQAWPCGPRGLIHPQGNYLRWVWVILKKLQHFLWGHTDAQTHRCTDTQTHRCTDAQTYRHTFSYRPCTTREKIWFFCTNLQNFYHFTMWRIS